MACAGEVVAGRVNPSSSKSIAKIPPLNQPPFHFILPRQKQIPAALRYTAAEISRLIAAENIADSTRKNIGIHLIIFSLLHLQEYNHGGAERVGVLGKVARIAIFSNNSVGCPPRTMLWSWYNPNAISRNNRPSVCLVVAVVRQRRERIECRICISIVPAITFIP
nr:MAG TPA: hypothetical protein [Caudoviricetes sp.]